MSAITPIGTALIRLSATQSISWTARDGSRHKLEIVTVSRCTTSCANLDRMSGVVQPGATA
ncbi:hypothetical protein [Xanthobacter flavus]|uniref:hypothetical protein n=1 Tax=Xanthobacter flavus TaxID=281 RepID=UPI00372D76C2